MYNSNLSSLIGKKKQLNSIKKLKKNSKKEIITRGQKLFLQLKKSLKRHFIQHSFYIYGISKLKMEQKSFPTSPKNFMSHMLEMIKVNNQAAYEKNMEEYLEQLGISAIQFHLTDFNEEDRDFSKFYIEKIMHTPQHQEILDKFWGLKHNKIQEHFLQAKIPTITNDQKEIINRKLLNCFHKARMRQMWITSNGLEDMKKIPEANNTYFYLKQHSSLEGMLGNRIDPAYRTDNLDITSHILYAESVHQPGYEGPGKIKFTFGYFSESNLFTFPFFAYLVDLDWATKFSIDIMPNNSIKIWEYPDVSAIFFLRLPDILGIFPSKGLIYAKIFIGLGLMSSWDIRIEPVASVIFQVGVFGIGFVQVSITRNLSRIYSIGKDVYSFLSWESGEEEMLAHNNTLEDYITNSLSLQIDKLDFTFAIDHRKKPTRLQRLLADSG